ncbi:PREDICTED: uncharacterized protein LOC108773320 [Cyphomyrmex costatus]|uniref:uncharacterized protein LOC108773320 n=1 Tax=Cyphomyrmex costatus TaxID=456900 RepID=UPI0008523CCC|nr:PREDICTED: uncharacterized protein LOC108773320 [Cyphomyrmex costatus]
MALSNELLKRLNSNDYPLAKRLKLAETAFCEDDLLLISKEDFLLEWLCKTCAMNQHAWKELNNCLKFNHINIRADIKQSLIDMLIQTLEKNNLKSTYDEVLECCSLIFVNNSMRQYFITKPKILGLLIKTVFNNVLKHSNYNTVIQKKINQLFEPYKLSPVEIDHTHIDNTNQLGIAAYKCIQQLLLGKNRSVQNKQTEESCQSMFSDLFCMLSENINTSNLQSNLLTYQFIFRTVIGTYKSDTILLDTFLRNLVNSSGKYKWEILDSFLKLLNDITLDFDNIIEGITLTEYFQNFISEILTDDKLLMENGCNDKLLEVLQILKKQISQEQWMQMANTISFETVLYLEILLHLPIIYFSTNVRTLIFLIVYFISKKCGKNDKVSVLCNMIFSDLLEKTGIDLFQYIEPKLLVNQLAQNKIFSKACEFSLRNVRTYATLKNLIKSCIQCKETMCIILESVLKMTFQTGKITDTLKRLTEATLKNIFTNDKLLQQSMQLFIIVLQHRKMFEIENMIINLWFIMLKHPHKNLIKLLLTSSELKEFCEFLRLLHDETIHILLQKKDEVVWTNIFVVWSNIMKIDMNVKRNKVRLNAINNLFETILTLDMPHRYWSELLCLSHDIISAKHLLIPDITIDLIILISLKSLDEVNISSCKDVLTICRTMMKVKTDLITDKLPNLLLLYRRTINIIVHASKSIINKFDEHRFRCYALDITKLTNVLVKLKTAMVRLAPYVIADLLLLIVEGTIPSYVKMALHESLCQLISICDQHGLAFLSRTLPTSSQEVFKVQLNTFKKFYKYSGKI